MSTTAETLEQRRPAFEQAVIDRMKEGGFLEVEIRVECLQRQGDGYYDGSVDAYWHFWNTALDSVEVELPSTEGFGEYSQEAARVMRDGCADALEDAGIAFTVA